MPRWPAAVSGDSLFDAVDALLAAAEPLPDPAERRRLREAGKLSLEQVGRALGVTGRTVAGWESAKSEPAGEKRAAYARLLDGLATRYPPPTSDAAAADTAPEPVDAPRPVPTRGRGAARHPAKGATATPPAASTAAAPDPRFTSGPFVVLDGDGTAHGVGGLIMDCPARTVTALVEWALDASLGASRLHRYGKDSDPLVVLTATATERFGLPARPADRRSLRLPDDHPVVKQLARSRWQLTRRGFGPWPRIYRPIEEGGDRRCVQLAVLPWDALDTRSWPGAVADLPPPELAAVLGDYAARLLTPRGTPATCGLELMSALRPPTRPVRDEETGRWVPGPVPGSMTRPVEPAWPRPRTPASSSSPTTASARPARWPPGRSGGCSRSRCCRTAWSTRPPPDRRST